MERFQLFSALDLDSPYLAALRRDRKVLLETKPNGWEQKIEKINSRLMCMVYSKKHARMADRKWLAANITKKSNGDMEFLKENTRLASTHEILKITFATRDGTPSNPDGLYFIQGSVWGPKELRCVAINGSKGGWDLLRDVYLGRCIQLHWRGLRLWLYIVVVGGGGVVSF